MYKTKSREPMSRVELLPFLRALRRQQEQEEENARLRPALIPKGSPIFVEHESYINHKFERHCCVIFRKMEPDVSQVPEKMATDGHWFPR